MPQIVFHIMAEHQFIKKKQIKGTVVLQTQGLSILFVCNTKSLVPNHGEMKWIFQHALWLNWYHCVLAQRPFSAVLQHLLHVT